MSKPNDDKLSREYDKCSCSSHQRRALVYFAALPFTSTFVEHRARMSCGQQLAVRGFAPSYRRATIMQVSLALVGLVLGLVAASRLRDTWIAAGAVLLGASIPFTLAFILLPTNSCWIRHSICKANESPNSQHAGIGCTQCGLS